MLIADTAIGTNINGSQPPLPVPNDGTMPNNADANRTIWPTIAVMAEILVYDPKDRFAELIAAGIVIMKSADARTVNAVTSSRYAL